MEEDIGYLMPFAVATTIKIPGLIKRTPQLPFSEL